MTLLCRVAENMFWLNRYVERAIATIRVLDVTAHLELDAGDPGRARRGLLDAAAGTCPARSSLRKAPLPGRKTSATSWPLTSTTPTRSPRASAALARPRGRSAIASRVRSGSRSTPPISGSWSRSASRSWRTTCTASRDAHAIVCCWSRAWPMRRWPTTRRGSFSHSACISNALTTCLDCWSGSHTC